MTAIPQASSRSTSVGRDIGLLLVSLALVGVVSVVGAGWTDTGSGSWYDQLDKPAWTPPGPVFAVVWSVLYLLMAVAAWLVARQGLDRPDVHRALLAYGVQLAANLGWTATFFLAQRPGWAVVEILALLGAVVVTIALFDRVSTVAATLLVPYLLWIGFATSLTIAIARGVG